MSYTYNGMETGEIHQRGYDWGSPCKNKCYFNYERGKKPKNWITELDHLYNGHYWCEANWRLKWSSPDFGNTPMHSCTKCGYCVVCKPSGCNQMDLELQILGLDSAKEKVDSWNQEMQEVIDKLDVKEQIVEKLLLKTDELLGITSVANEHLINLDAKLGGFLTMIDRLVNYKTSMKDYFEQRNIGDFVSPLNDLGYTQLSQLHCQDEKEFDVKILTKLEEKLKKDVKSRDQSQLRRICIHPETSWQPFEDDKASIIKQSLVLMSPVLIQGFKVISDKVKAVIQYKQKAIKILEHMDDDKSDDNDEIDINSVVQYDCRLNLSNINYDQNNMNQSTAMDLLQNTASSCTFIFEQERQMKESVLVCRSIIYYEPSNPSNTAKELWDSIDANIHLIKDCYISSATVSIKYFGYFDQFKVLFAQVQKSNASMDSLQQTLAAIQEFNNVKDSFSQQISKLEESAKRCIEDGVRKGVTLKQYQNIRENRDGAIETYKEKLKGNKGIHVRYDKQIHDLLMKRHDLMAQRYANRCSWSKIQLSGYNNRSNCPGNHGLKQLNTGTKYYRCDGCMQAISFNTTMWGCDICNYHLCNNCKQ